MSKAEEKVLSKYSGYSIEELHERLTDPIIQPYDCFMAMIEFAEAYHKSELEAIGDFEFMDNQGTIYKNQDPYGLDMGGVIRIRPKKLKQ